MHGAGGVEFSPDPQQRYLYVTSEAGVCWILRHSDLQSLNSFDITGGHYIGVDSHWPGGAAEFLGVKPTTLAARIKKAGLKRPDRE